MSKGKSPGLEPGIAVACGLSLLMWAAVGVGILIVRGCHGVPHGSSGPVQAAKAA